MLKTSAMSPPKNASKKKNKDGVINSLRDLFGNVLHIDIIKTVALECDFDVQRSSNLLLEMSNNIDTHPRKNPQNRPKKSPEKTPQKSAPKVVKSKKSLDLERVINNIRQGYKVLVILRGLPGSGKSQLAVGITDITLGPGDNSRHILSTDDFFSVRGQYFFDRNRLPEAHEANHRRAFQAMSLGISPVIIDNTNTQMWEMKPYAMMATDYGYLIEILEPDTWWAFNEKELARRNQHGVPRPKIKEMLDRYDKNVTTQKLLSAYSLTYKFQKPPQFRLFPPVIRSGIAPQKFFAQNGVVKSKSTPILDCQKDKNESVNLMDFDDVSSEISQTNSQTLSWDVDPMDQILMCTQENVTEILQPITSEQKTENRSFPELENAWGIDEKALHSWDIVTPISEINTPPVILTPVNEELKCETKESSTSIDPDDFDAGFRVIQAQNRDINFGQPVKFLPPPKKIMLDKSSLTEDEDEIDKDEDNRIKDLIDLFPKVSKASLYELYLKCNKDFHWTVDLLLEDNNLEVATEVVEDSKSEVMLIDSAVEAEEEVEQPKEIKVFKRKTISEDCLELKKCLESKIDINKEHYSDHVYRVKQTKFGCQNEPQPSTSSAISDSESDDDSSHSDDPKNLIELNLGEVFVNQLETMFGSFAFPQGYQPVVQMPIALARQIYTFYIESICQQMEAQNHILDRLVKEDEEFARKLQKQEEESQPERPMNFSEIMDEQVALSLHRQDVDQWKNMTVDSLAAKLTKQKLFNTFPNIDQASLMEIWHAYDYDYNKTVEDLIASVGLENANGSREAIAEPPLSQNTLEEMKQAEESCIKFEEAEEQQPATYYREEANKHLKKREQLFEKAKSYYQRGMTEVAAFYSELARKETQFYDQANHVAAAAFIDEHSKRLQKFDTLDLHYFYVKEAIPNLDIFIDRNINLLKGGAKRAIDLFVITGRGKNSEGGRCRIKPAVINRLKKRNIGYVQLNPGLLKIRVLKDSLMTSDL